MKYTKAKQIEINNAVQQEIPSHLVEEFFNKGVDLWFFIEDYEFLTEEDTEEREEDDDFTFGMSQEEASERLEDPLFPMSCIGCSQEDTKEDIDPAKKYFAQTSAFLEFESGGDGVTFEIWEHCITGEHYHVPISIERNFDNLTKI